MLLLCAAATFAAWSAAGSPGDAALHDIAFTAEHDGSEQRYMLLFPPGYRAETPCDALVALHGHGADRSQFPTDGRDECRAARDVAADRGMLLVSPDYRARTSWMGPAAEADMIQILREVRARHQIRRVFVCGGSMGGTSALTFAALHPESVAGVASMNGMANHFEFENYQDAIQVSFGGTKAEIPLEYKNRSAEYWPERFTMPVAITTGGKDAQVPPGSALRLASVLRALERRVLVIHREDGGHSTDYADARAILEFMIDQAE